jgi:teichuronic acid biosynthesis glycosyltransferase TuaC
MKVIFVSSGNIKKFGISPIVINQGNSIKNEGIDVVFYGIKGKGFLNYLKNIKTLRKFLQENQFDIIHAHYSLSAIIATIAKKRTPIVVSLMGSDSNGNFFYRNIVKFFHRFYWDVTIVKSQNIKDNLLLKNVEILPNGVNFDLFKPIDQNQSRDSVDFCQDKKYIVFIANPERVEKNIKLAIDGVNLLKGTINAELFVVFGKDGIDHEKIPMYLNAADALVLTSTNEGSPNVVKEAMACNCPVVSTDVGDVRSIIAQTDGCFITEFNAEDVASNLLKAINYGKTNGREKIEHLNSKKIAIKLISIYNNLLKK